jgi:hypothetical protein
LGFGDFTQAYELQHRTTQRKGESKAESVFDKIKNIASVTLILYLKLMFLFQNECH